MSSPDVSFFFLHRKHRIAKFEHVLQDSLRATIHDGISIPLDAHGSRLEKIHASVDPSSGAHTWFFRVFFPDPRAFANSSYEKLPLRSVRQLAEMDAVFTSGRRPCSSSARSRNYVAGANLFLNPFTYSNDNDDRASSARDDDNNPRPEINAVDFAWDVLDFNVFMRRVDVDAREWWAARVIQNRFMERHYDPRYALCRQRLVREAAELTRIM